MNPHQHKSNNRVLGAPRNWNQSRASCGALPITDVLVEGQQVVVSFWRPTEAELEQLNAGASVALWIWGKTMPPAHIGVES